MTWLIAEDEADIRNLIAMMCTAWGHTPQTFDNGQKVWDWLDKFETKSENGAHADVQAHEESDAKADTASVESNASAPGKPAETKAETRAEPKAETKPAVDSKPAPELPELVLMDIRMPGKKGNEVAQRMRTLPQFERTPIILMTAYSLSEAERNAMMTGDGVDHILNKPLPDFEQLRTILHDLLTRKQSNDSTDTDPATS